MSHRALAAALLRQAVYDAAGIIDPKGYARPATVYASGKRVGRRPTQELTKEQVQAEAYAWLTTESASLEFWCRVAGIEMDVVIEGVDGAIRTVKMRARAPGGGKKRK